jgi:alpha-ketoglutarate-dependent taurine dioxygenase
MNAPARLEHVIDGKRAWVRADLRREDWLFKLPPECLAELKALLPQLAAHLTPVENIDAAPHVLPALPACRALMGRVKRALDDGVRFALIDRLPIDEIGDEVAHAFYWILSSMIARPVQQKVTGTWIYPVHDTGRKATAGSGVRPDQTNMEQFFHNDNSYNTAPPEYVALLCMQPAKSGGVSHVINFYAVHNALVRAHPHVIARLYQSFWYDRQGEPAPDGSDTMSAPLFTYDTHNMRLRARMGLFQIGSGYQMRGETLDAAGAEAVTTLKRVLADESLSFDFVLERGHLQFVNNREIGHRRTAFHDYDEPTRKRRLMRLWLRDAGGIGYHG